MSVLFNPKHERFAQGVAKGLDPAEAYKKAGYKGGTTDIGLASAVNKLMRDADIKDRILEINKVAARRAAITRATIHEMLLEDREFAKSCKNPAAAIRAAELLGKDIGMFVDRREIKTTILDDMSDEQLIELEQSLEKSIAAGAREALSGSSEETPGK